MSAGWIVLICIVLFIAFLLWFPIRICLAYSDDGFVCSLKLLFWKFPLFPRKEKELTEEEKKKQALKEQRKAEKKAAREAEKKEKEAKKKKKAPAEPKKKKWSFGEILHLVGMIAKSAGKLAKRFWKGFVVDKLTLHMAVAGSDAADAAISYGRMNAQIYTGYAFLEQYVTLKNTDIRIVPDFLSTKSTMEVSCELFFRVGTLIASVFAAGWHFLKLLVKDRNEAAKMQEQTVS